MSDEIVRRDAASLRVEEIIGDAFAEAYGLVDRDDEEPPFDPDLDEDDQLTKGETP